jgi:hypothetical protein
MDFQRLFKRREEGSEPSIIRDNLRESFNEREVLVSEGQLLEGTTPACLAWSSVGGTIRVKGEKILGILEGRTRIKATALQDLYPGLFEKAPNPGTEFNIPLQAVVMQLQDLFTNLSSEAAVLDDFATPFGELAREDEARFKDQHEEQSELGKMATPKLVVLPQPGSPGDLIKQDQSTEREPPTIAPLRGLSEENSSGNRKSGPGRTLPDLDCKTPRSKGVDPSAEKVSSASQSQSGVPGGTAIPSGAQRFLDDNIRREGHELLQELYLTDELIDGSKVARMILLLPHVAGVVIMLSDGAALGGGIGGGLSEALLGLTPAFVKHLLDFGKSIQGGSVKFVTISGHPYQLSLTVAGDVVILAGHEGKNLPPGLRERLVATAHALNMIYGLP